MRAPTDLQILQTIYNSYYEEYSKFDESQKNSRGSKIYVPIDCGTIAARLKVDGDIVFGRLYYHLEEKHGYRREDKTKVHFFCYQLGSDMHCINFPLMTSLLAQLQEDDRRARQTNRLAWIAIIISALSAGVSAATAIGSIAG